MKNARMHKCGAYPFAKYFILYDRDDDAKRIFGDLDGTYGMTAMLGGQAVCVYIASGLGHADTLSTLVHESAHVWQMIRGAAGEEGHSPEAEAYGIQQIFSDLRKDLIKLVEHAERKSEEQIELESAADMRE